MTEEGISFFLPFFFSLKYNSWCQTVSNYKNVTELKTINTSKICYVVCLSFSFFLLHLQYYKNNRTYLTFVLAVLWKSISSFPLLVFYCVNMCASVSLLSLSTWWRHFTFYTQSEMQRDKKKNNNNNNTFTSKMCTETKYHTLYSGIIIQEHIKHVLIM